MRLVCVLPRSASGDVQFTALLLNVQILGSRVSGVPMRTRVRLGPSDSAPTGLVVTHATVAHGVYGGIVMAYPSFGLHGPR